MRVACVPGKPRLALWAWPFPYILDNLQVTSIVKLAEVLEVRPNLKCVRMSPDGKSIIYLYWTIYLPFQKSMFHYSSLPVWYVLLKEFDRNVLPITKTLQPDTWGHFVDDIFKWMPLIARFLLLITVSIKFVLPQVPTAYVIHFSLV